MVPLYCFIKHVAVFAAAAAATAAAAAFLFCYCCYGAIGFDGIIGLGWAFLTLTHHVATRHCDRTDPCASTISLSTRHRAAPDVCL